MTATNRITERIKLINIQVNQTFQSKIMLTNSKQFTVKKLLLSIGAFFISSSAILGFSSQAFALDIEAGLILNNNAKVKCPVTARVYNVRWNGQWRTTAPGKMSVCGIK